MTQTFNKIALVVIDSVGIGALPDAEAFGDAGTSTLGRIVRHSGETHIPNLLRLGLGCIDGIDYLPCPDDVVGAYGKSDEASQGKDTSTGHWEIAGLRIDVPFKTYPQGFPAHIIHAFEEKIGRKILCNRPASGTEVIAELGELHMQTGSPIVYTSADSVFQIAAHEEIIPLPELYRMCEIARALLQGEDQVARVIARPFIGKPGKFVRTSNRRDYSIKPFGKTLLDFAKADGFAVKAVGKIVDIFDGEGITEDVHTKDNMDGVDKTLEAMKGDFKGIVFTNLVDFDAKFGHRRDIPGYRNALEEFDRRIPELMDALGDQDALFIVADHGNDPGHTGTDHTREYIPILVYGKRIKAGANIGIRKTFADIGATIAQMLGVNYKALGTSFMEELC
ncbi:MAG: phosphopentomutase [Bacillota bacterium]|nr:phosphopentomutase [Bacillota bacterium]